MWLLRWLVRRAAWPVRGEGKGSLAGEDEEGIGG
jgi:hypothetical protein